MEFMSQFLAGKKAVVTGGTRGIGFAVASALLKSGASVAICGRTRRSVDTALAELSPLGEVVGVPADVSNRNDVERFFGTVKERFGGLDILVNNAGVGVFKPITELTPEEWHQQIDLNVNGVYYCCHAALPLLQHQGGGYIIQISSLAGKNPLPGGTGYNASKFAINGFSEAMMLDLRYHDIRVSYIMPGSVDTDFSSHGVRAPWKIQPEDIAEVVLFLLNLPKRTLVSRIEVRPSKPQR
jgi:3-oxoacyl-[acyl-carrier protein] reductase